MTEAEELAFCKGTKRMLDQFIELEKAIKTIQEFYYQSRYDFEDIKSEYFYFLCELIDKTEEEVAGEISCYVYFILNQEKDKVKIGVSTNPVSRAKQLQTASGEDISIYHTIEFKNREEAYEAENFLHREFSEYRKKPTKVSKSCEWFDAVILPELMEYYSTAENIRTLYDYRRSEQKKAMQKLSIII